MGKNKEDYFSAVKDILREIAVSFIPANLVRWCLRKSPQVLDR